MENGGNDGHICSRFVCSSTQQRDSFARSGTIRRRRENPHVVSVAGDGCSLVAPEHSLGARCCSVLAKRKRCESTTDRGVHEARTAVGKWRLQASIVVVLRHHSVLIVVGTGSTASAQSAYREAQSGCCGSGEQQSRQQERASENGSTEPA